MVEVRLYTDADAAEWNGFVAGASAVVLAKGEGAAPDYNLTDALSEDYTRVRIFGKPEQHPGRRMGVVLCYGDTGADTTALRDKAKRLAATVIR